MEKELGRYMRTQNELAPERMSALILAYIGDAVYEVLVRRYLVSSGITKVKDLHKQAVKFVNASTQSKVVRKLEKVLTLTELEVLKRGRNAKSGSAPKNIDMIDYRYGTGFEALIGYLYLSEQIDRLEELFALAVDIISQEENY